MAGHQDLAAVHEELLTSDGHQILLAVLVKTRIRHLGSISTPFYNGELIITELRKEMD